MGHARGCLSATCLLQSPTHETDYNETDYNIPYGIINTIKYHNTGVTILSLHPYRTWSVHKAAYPPPARYRKYCNTWPSSLQDMERARGCFRHLRTLFQELEECRAFELLKGQADRVNYLMTKQVCYNS